MKTVMQFTGQLMFTLNHRMQMWSHWLVIDADFLGNSEKTVSKFTLQYYENIKKIPRKTKTSNEHQFCGQGQSN